jgi:hypothetical protein
MKLTMKGLETVTLLAVKGPAIHMRGGMLSHKTDRRVSALALGNLIHLPVEIQFQPIARSTEDNRCYPVYSNVTLSNFKNYLQSRFKEMQISL